MASKVQNLLLSAGKWRVESREIKPFWTKTAKNAQKNSGPQNRLYRYIYIYVYIGLRDKGREEKEIDRLSMRRKKKEIQRKSEKERRIEREGGERDEESKRETDREREGHYKILNHCNI